MADTITLRNRRKRQLVINLPHGDVPELASVGVVATREHDATPVRGPRDTSSPNAGARTLRVERRALSGSLTLTARGCHEGGDYARDLPRSVLRAPEVQRATRGPDPDVEVVEPKPTVEAAESAPDPAPEKKAAPPRRAVKETE